MWRQNASTPYERDEPLSGSSIRPERACATWLVILLPGSVARPIAPAPAAESAQARRVALDRQLGDLLQESLHYAITRR